MKVRYTSQARADLDEIFAYLDQCSPTDARSVKVRIASVIRRLSDHPFMAPETDEPDVRELAIVRHPYKVYYEIEGDEVWIVHIRHTARRPWNGRPDKA